MTGWQIAGVCGAWLLGVALQLQQFDTVAPGAVAGEVVAAVLLSAAGAIVGRGAHHRVR